MIYKDYKKSKSYYVKQTTERRISIIAIICSLKKLKYPVNINLYTDNYFVYRYVMTTKNRDSIKSWNLFISYQRDCYHLLKELDVLISVHKINCFHIKKKSKSINYPLVIERAKNAKKLSNNSIKLYDCVCLLNGYKYAPKKINTVEKFDDIINKNKNL
jgi:ribonuclease HI